MELPIILWSAVVGAIVGVLVLMFARKPRSRGSEIQAAAMRQLQDGEPALAMAPFTVEDLRKVLTERDQTLLQSRDDLEKKQQQLDAATAEVVREAGLRSAAEQRSAELAAQAAALAEEMKAIEAKAREDRQAAEEAGLQVSPLEMQLASEKRQSQELTEQIAKLTAELAERQRSTAEAGGIRSALEAELGSCRENIQQLTAQLGEFGQERSELETQIANEQRQSQQLAEHIAQLTAELDERRRSNAQTDGYRSSLEAELGSYRDTIQQLTAQLGEARRERSEFVARLGMEHQAAGEAMKLLSLAQANLSGFFERPHENPPNGNGHVTFEAVPAGPGRPLMEESPIDPGDINLDDQAGDLIPVLSSAPGSQNGN